MTSCFEVSDGIAYLTASIIGANHRALLLPNQDHAKYKYSTDSFMLVVSDGVGSCSKSELGSEYACAAAVEVFDELLDEKLEYDFDCILPALICKWRERIGDDNPDDYCATMKIAIKHLQRKEIRSVRKSRQKQKPEILKLWQNMKQFLKRVGRTIVSKQRKCVN